MSDYQIRRYDTSGNLLDVISGSNEADYYSKRFARLEYVRAENSMGGMNLLVPMGDYQYEDFSTNQILEIWFEVGGSLQLLNETAYFLRDWELQSFGGEQLINLFAYDANWLLASRIVAANAGSAQAEMTDYADDMMKAIVEDQLGATAVAGRDLSSWLTIAGNLSDSQSISKAFSRRNLLTVCQEIADAGTSAGTRTYFDVVRTGIAKFAFRTYTGQRGQDHGRSSGDIRHVSEQAGNFDDIKFGTYHSEEKNYIYAGGQGEEDAREIVEVSDSDRIADGYPFNRCEGWVDARHCDTTALVTAEANAGLAEGEPKQIMTGRIIDTDDMKYAVHYGFGDIVSAEAFGFNVDCHVSQVKEIVDKNGVSRDIRLRGVL
jgi:hypothetical protein